MLVDESGSRPRVPNPYVGDNPAAAHMAETLLRLSHDGLEPIPKQSPPLDRGTHDWLAREFPPPDGSLRPAHDHVRPVLSSRLCADRA